MTYAVYGRWSHKMKQTQTRVVSGGRRDSSVLAGERKGSSSNSGEWSGSMLNCKYAHSNPTPNYLNIECSRIVNVPPNLQIISLTVL